MSRIFVVAGGIQQFRYWCQENKVSHMSPLVQYIPEGQYYQLEGTLNPQVVFYGTYYNRRDIRELNNLIACLSFRPCTKETIKNGHTTWHIRFVHKLTTAFSTLKRRICQ